jgi:hypothetical protein
MTAPYGEGMTQKTTKPCRTGSWCTPEMQKGPTLRWGPSKYYLPTLAKNQPAKVGVASTGVAGAGAIAGAAVAGAAVAGAAAAALVVSGAATGL